jgi:hypothetical protein
MVRTAIGVTVQRREKGFIFQRSRGVRMEQEYGAQVARSCVLAARFLAASALFNVSVLLSHASMTRTLAIVGAAR